MIYPFLAARKRHRECFSKGAKSECRPRKIDNFQSAFTFRAKQHGTCHEGDMPKPTTTTIATEKRVCLAGPAGKNLRHYHKNIR